MLDKILFHNTNQRHNAMTIPVVFDFTQLLPNKCGKLNVCHAKQICSNKLTRLLIYVHCADNYRSSAVLEVAKFGLLSRVLSDQGMNNLGVAT